MDDGMDILIVAYVLTGVRKVINDLRFPFSNQPEYVRRRRYGIMFLVVLGWVLVDVGMILAGLWRDMAMLRATLSNFLTFAVLAVLGFAFL